MVETVYEHNQLLALRVALPQFVDTGASDVRLWLRAGLGCGLKGN